MYSNLQLKQAKVLDFWREAEPAGIWKLYSGMAASGMEVGGVSPPALAGRRPSRLLMHFSVSLKA